MASDLSHIVDVPDTPMELFQKWLKEAKTHMILAETLCLSTVDRNGKVHARNLILRSIKRNNFLIMTDKRSTKFDEILFNPNVAMTFLWIYKKDDKNIFKQVRVEGTAKQLNDTEVEEIYNTEPLYSKIRAYICNQSQKGNWDDLKKSHDSLLQEVNKEGKQLPKPDHVVGFEIQADNMDFYYSLEGQIADRVKYKKCDEMSWNNYHVHA